MTGWRSLAPENTCPTGWARPHPLTAQIRLASQLHVGRDGQGALDFRAPPQGFQGGDLRVGFMWGHLPPAGPAPTRWSFGGGRGDWKAVSEGHLGGSEGQPCLPTAMLAFNKRVGMQGLCRVLCDGPNRQDHEDPSPPKQGGWSVPGAPSTSSQGGQGVFLLTLRWSRGVFGPREASGAGVPEQAPASTRKAAAWA